jgi:hypothetical protein
MTPESDAILRWLAVQEEAAELRRSNPDWRHGQALFNALRMMDPPLAEQIRGTPADPFNDNIHCPEFMAAVMRGTSAVSDVCGGCRNIGNHRRHCLRHPDYHPFRALADCAESIGDSIGVPELANQAWALASAIRDAIPDHPYPISPAAGDES